MLGCKSLISICVLYTSCQSLWFRNRYFYCRFFKEVILLVDSEHRSDTITQCRTTWPSNMNISAGGATVVQERCTLYFTNVIKFYKQRS